MIHFTWWMYVIIFQIVFIVIVIIHYIVKKVNESRLEDRIEIQSETTSVSTQVSLTSKQETKRQEVKNLKEDKRSTKSLSLIFNKEKNEAKTDLLDLPVNDSWMIEIFNKGVKPTSSNIDTQPSYSAQAFASDHLPICFKTSTDKIHYFKEPASKDNAEDISLKITSTNKTNEQVVSNKNIKDFVNVKNGHSSNQTEGSLFCPILENDLKVQSTEDIEISEKIEQMEDRVESVKMSLAIAELTAALEHSIADRKTMPCNSKGSHRSKENVNTSVSKVTFDPETKDSQDTKISIKPSQLVETNSNLDASNQPKSNVIKMTSRVTFAEDPPVTSDERIPLADIITVNSDDNRVKIIDITQSKESVRRYPSRVTFLNDSICSSELEADIASVIEETKEIESNAEMDEFDPSHPKRSKGPYGQNFVDGVFTIDNTFNTNDNKDWININTKLENSVQLQTSFENLCVQSRRMKDIFDGIADLTNRFDEPSTSKFNSIIDQTEALLNKIEVETQCSPTKTLFMGLLKTHDRLNHNNFPKGEAQVHQTSSLNRIDTKRKASLDIDDSWIVKRHSDAETYDKTTNMVNTSDILNLKSKILYSENIGNLTSGSQSLKLDVENSNNSKPLSKSNILQSTSRVTFAKDIEIWTENGSGNNTVSSNDNIEGIDLNKSIDIKKRYPSRVYFEADDDDFSCEFEAEIASITEVSKEQKPDNLLDDLFQS